MLGQTRRAIAPLQSNGAVVHLATALAGGGVAPDPSWHRKASIRRSAPGSDDWRRRPARRGVNPEGPRRIKVGFPHRDKGGPVGVIVPEEYVCDYCTKPIAHSDVIVGKL